ncbi:beta-ketoacyl-ACP synthase III [Shewanella sp. NIFS-20-20]|uniref:beta-ketoacyl-ACP synthase III n=1 Tax=Shewanella sp. NIFS-20-20 TaxID=2853806 RepID=UPI001C47990B|nr:beta-ketoacyl-ACP synthase III [Shewanella sp. NIFS-20-20]MBV7315545.1 beta-ketoacyl-ACP synthase III [Shewanella sp. NIFS-20-20]
MKPIVISGSGLYTPPEVITNDELVASYNQYADNYNQQHAAAIAAGHTEALAMSSVEFIEKASGIKQRHVICKQGMLDPQVMMPLIKPRADDELSLQAQMGVSAAKEALANADCQAGDIDLVIVACAYTQRAYPAIAIEIQQHLGCQGMAYDMQVACSSATFAIANARAAIMAGLAHKVLVINPEICTPQINLRDRDSHFIFGDVATALVIEPAQERGRQRPLIIESLKLVTDYSSNIRSNFGLINRCDPDTEHSANNLFSQQGRKVFKELLPMIHQHLAQQLQETQLSAFDFKRFWLHQANINMNLFVAKKLLADKVTPDLCPVVLDKYANTASAGSIIALHLYRDDFQSDDLGLLCSFGAGYSIGSVILRAL